MPKDRRIRLLARKAPGIVAALNTGLQHARGHFIARMDDDDIACPERLQVQYDYLRSLSKRHLCATRVRFVDAAGSTKLIAGGYQRYESWLNSMIEPEQLKLACFRECPMPHPTLMAHRNIWAQLGGYRAVNAPEDHDLILRAMLKGIPLSKPEPVLQLWREHDQRLTHFDQRYRQAAFVERAAWAATREQSGLALHAGRGIWLCGTGRHARHWHDALHEYNASVRGFVDLPSSKVDRLKRQLPVIDYAQLANVRGDDLIISAVTQPQARNQVIDFMIEQGWTNGSDFLIGG